MAILYNSNEFFNKIKKYLDNNQYLYSYEKLGDKIIVRIK